MKKGMVQTAANYQSNPFYRLKLYFMLEASVKTIINKLQQIFVEIEFKWDEND